MTPSAYMTDETWKGMVRSMCQGIRAMPKIRDHEDWWCLLSLDGFGSHLCPEALEVFAEFKILVFKEEGDSSQICQAYDQLVAKQDKKVVRDLLDVLRFYKHGVVGQWNLIFTLNTAFNFCNNDSWRQSHIRVNTCPSQLVPFEQWLKKHEKGVNAADRFFEKRDSLYDAMPAAWKHMTEAQRREVCAMLDLFEKKSDEDPTKALWDVDNVRKLMELGYVKYDDIPKLRGCHLTAKDDPSVFVNPVPLSEEDVQKKEVKRMRQLALDVDYSCFTFAPSHLMEPYVSDKKKHPPIVGPLPKGVSRLWNKKRSVDIAAVVFRHMTNFVAMHHGWHTGSDLVPSAHLQVEVTKEQVDMLNPTPRDIQMAAIVDQCSGKKAMKVIAKRRIEFIDGNVNSYARILNGPQQLRRIKCVNDLAASIAALQREDEVKAGLALEDKKVKDAEKAARKEERDRKEEEKRVRLAPECKEEVDKGIDNVLSLTNLRRKEILKYHFNITSGLANMRLADTESKLRELMGAVVEDNAGKNNSTGEGGNAEDAMAVGNEGSMAIEANDNVALPLPALPQPESAAPAGHFEPCDWNRFFGCVMAGIEPKDRCQHAGCDKIIHHACSTNAEMRQFEVDDPEGAKDLREGRILDATCPYDSCGGKYCLDHHPHAHVFQEC